MIFKEALEKILSAIDLNLDVTYEEILNGDCRKKVVDARTVFVQLLLELGFNHPIINSETGLAIAVISHSKSRHKRMNKMLVYNDKYEMVKKYSDIDYDK